MTTYLLDTNQVSKLLDGHAAVVDRVAQIGLDRVSISVVVCGELAFMARHSAFMDFNLERVTRLLKRIDIIPVDLDTAHVFGELKHEFVRTFGPRNPVRRSKIKAEQLGLRDNDLWIASTAIRRNLTLVSSDAHFARIREVHPFDLEAWWTP